MNCLQELSSRRLQDVSSRCLQDMSSRRLQGMSSRRLEDQQMFAGILLSTARNCTRTLQTLFGRSNRDAFLENEGKIHERRCVKQLFT